MIWSMVRIEWGAEGRGWQVFGAAGMESMATIMLLKEGFGDSVGILETSIYSEDRICLG